MNRLALLFCVLAAAAWAAPRKGAEDGRQVELDALEARVAKARSALESEIAARWDAKQRHVGRRETDREELARLSDAQERAYLELSRVKEECFSRERLIEDARTGVEQARDEWLFVGSTGEELLEQEADRVLEAFPLDREDRRMAVENVRRSYQEDGRALDAIEKLVAYKAGQVAAGTRVSIEKQNVIPEEGGVRQLTIARFGHVFGYGMSIENEVFFIRQTGQIGRRRYVVERIGEPSLVATLADRFPSWIENGAAVGDVPVDVLQNAQSRILTTGEKAEPAARFWQYVRAGGPVMVPLLLLPLWALALVVLKLVQLASKRRAGRRLYAGSLACIDKNDIASARTLVAGTKSAVGRVIAACLEHSEWDRETAEKAVRELLAQEMPLLNKHLNTLAVIAGVAPLLGLLGTVTGMINLFEVITNYGTGDPKIMAGGISEALITTQTGLTIAIPILLIHNWLRNRTSRLQAEIETAAITVLNRLWPTKRREVINGPKENADSPSDNSPLAISH